MSQELIIPLKLQEAIKSNNLVFFVGAGCSIPLGFPTWQKLIEDILIELNEKFGKTSDTNFQNILTGVKSGSKSLFEALNKIENDNDHGPTYKIKSKEIVNARIEKSSESFPNESPVHTVLWKISERIITTNYDKALEKYKPNDLHAKIFDNKNPFQSLRSQLEEAKFLYKIHGDYENPESITLFESDYKEIYKNYNEDTLSTFFKGKTLLFIGFSLTDPFVNALFTKIKMLYNGYTVNEHFVFTTKNEDFTEFDITPIPIENWEESLFGYLTKLEEIKSLSSETDNKLTSLTKETNGDKLTANDVTSIVKLIEIKTKELSNNPGDKELHKEVNDLRVKINKLMFGEIDYSQEVDKPFRNADLQALFDVIYSSEKLDRLTLERIQNVRTKTDLYKWYDRSVIVSAIACSLIHHNKADEQKIILLIDFINDYEDKVWQKALTCLFMVLNHLGNKWLRFNSIKTKVKSLNNNLSIQNGCSVIIQVFNVGLNNVSMINENLFKNPYFGENPFNYFLPYHQDENPSFEVIYDTYTGENIEEYINAINQIPIPDQLKYLLCRKNSDLKKGENEKTSKKLQTILNLNQFFYPFSIYVQELISFYKFFPQYKHEEKLKAQLKLTETPLKDYLLNAKEKYYALGVHFMKEKNWSQAIVNLKEAIKLDANNVTYLLNLANCYNYNKDKNEEFQIRSDIKRIEPKNVQNLEKLHDYYFTNQKDYNKSIEISDELINIEPKVAEHYQLKSLSFSELNHYEKALEYIDVAISLNSNNEKFYVNKALFYQNLDEFEKSNFEFEKAISISPNDMESYLNKATNYMLLTHFDKALNEIIKAEALNTEVEFVFNSYANYYRLTKYYKKAFEYIEKAIKIKSAYNFIGTKAAIYASMGDYDSFYVFLEKAIIEGADVNLFYNDIKKKFKHEKRFNDLLIKYNQRLNY